MHLQEVFNAIYANHTYEYFVVDEDFRVIEHSDQVFRFCNDHEKKCDIIFSHVPELYGMEEQMHAVKEGKSAPFSIPNVYKAGDEYVNVHVHPGRKRQNGPGYETLIILFEVITEKAKAHQHLIQERNEKSLVLHELARKNRELDLLNKEMEKRVEEATRKYLEKSRMIELQSRHTQMGEMIGMITHQWKQPISAAYLLIHVLKTKLSNETCDIELFTEKLEQLKHLIHHMDETVHAFQEFFNPSKTRVVFNIYDTIRKIIDLVEYEFIIHNIRIDIDGDRTLSASGYPNEFNQVILSLLKNAKDAFLRKPHEDMRIHINLKKEGGYTVVRVADNAGGIPEDIIDRIFEPYVTTKKNGSGIGLNIAKTIIEENMNGTIEVHNTVEGAEFVIKL